MKNAVDVIKKVLLTEKGTRLAEENSQFLFEVTKDANKVEIKKAVEELFNVRVMAVNTMRRKGKKKRARTAAFGTTASSKRAVVKVHKEDVDKMSLI